MFCEPKKISLAFLMTAALAALSGCGSLKAEHPERPLEYYATSSRQLPPPPVYSRVTWSYLPQPFPAKSRSLENAPLLREVIHFELLNSNLGEAIEALSQTIGYQAEYPASLADRKVSLNMDGSLEEVLSEVARQAKVNGELDRVGRVVRVSKIEPSVQPSLP